MFGLVRLGILNLTPHLITWTKVVRRACLKLHSLRHFVVSAIVPVITGASNNSQSAAKLYELLSGTL